VPQGLYGDSRGPKSWPDISMIAFVEAIRHIAQKGIRYPNGRWNILAFAPACWSPFAYFFGELVIGKAPEM